MHETYNREVPVWNRVSVTECAYGYMNYSSLYKRRLPHFLEIAQYGTLPNPYPLTRILVVHKQRCDFYSPPNQNQLKSEAQIDINIALIYLCGRGSRTLAAESSLLHRLRIL